MIAQRPVPNLRLPRSGLITMRRLRWFAAWVTEQLGHHIAAAGVQMLRDTNRSHILHWLPEGAIGMEGEQGEIGPPGLPGDPSDIPGPPGVAGKTGPQGLKGNPGPRGDPGDDGKPGKNGVDGIDGINGVDAPDGAKGPDGPRGYPDPGEKGEKGPPGNPGPPGLNILGIKGEPGTQPANQTTVIGPQLDGYKGDMGPPGTPGDVEKTALLETSLGIIGMAALEGEEALFKDHVTAPLTAGFVAVDLDAVFKGTVEPGSLFVQHAFIPRCTAAIGAKIVHMAGRTCVEARVHPAPRFDVHVTFTIAGIRKGCASMRLPIFTRDQMAANNRFYARAHNGLTS